MRNHLIAIQGSLASYHDLAARKYFGEDVSVLECGSFREVCDKVSENNADYGIIAIENRIAGSILLNYHLIEEYELFIIGETYLPIELQLFGKNGTSLEDVKEIISHPMALGQSQSFLSKLKNVLVTEYRDTASSAKAVVTEKGNHLAVIAGPAVGKKYGLSLIKSQVGDVVANYTRFYIISKGRDFAQDPNKASIALQTGHEPGKLSDLLSIIKKSGFNLTKIQSVPLPENPNAYSFHLDIEFDNKNHFLDAMKELKKETWGLKVLGMYKSEKPNQHSPNLN
jgi:prephenate dehydratase